MRGYCGLAAAVIVLLGAARTAGKPDPRTERLATLLRAYEEQDAFSGVVLVTEGDSILLRRGFGMADRELGVKAAPEHRFLIGSMTKAFTAMLALQQVAAGRLDLDSSVRRSWADFPDPSGGQITFRHLLTHHSGLRHWGGIAGFLDSTARLARPPAETLGRFAALGLQFAPGTRDSYSSLGYLALGVTLERSTDSSLAALLAARIFAPLGMGATSLDDGVTIVPGRARAYRYSFLEARYQNAEYRDPSTTWSTGGILTTVDDLWRWGRAISGGRLLPDSLSRLLFDPGQGEAAYGWRRDDSRAEVAFWHGGQVTGYRSELMLVPSRRQVIVVLGNLRDLDTDDIVTRIRRVLAGEAVDPPKRSLMKAVLEAAARGGGAGGVARYRAIRTAEAERYDTASTSLLTAAIELRSDGACDRAAPLFEVWLADNPESPYGALALASAADCRLRLGELAQARALTDRLGQRFPKDSRLAELRRRLTER